MLDNFQNFFNRIAVTQKFENRLHRNSFAANGRFAVADIRVNRDSFFKSVHKKNYCIKINSDENYLARTDSLKVFIYF